MFSDWSFVAKAPALVWLLLDYCEKFSKYNAEHFAIDISYFQFTLFYDMVWHGFVTCKNL